MLVLTHHYLSWTSSGTTNIYVRFSTSARWILLIHFLAHSIHRFWPYQIDRTSSETTTHHASTQYTRHASHNFYQCIQLNTAHFILVPQACMSFIENRAC